MNAVQMPKRKEMRYIVRYEDEFLARLKERFEEVRYSENEFVETVVFCNIDHPLHFGHSVRARRFLPDQKAPVLDDGKYFIDMKSRSGKTNEKIRREGTLADVADVVNQYYNFDSPITPYVASSYHRRHFVPKSGNGIRVTLDSDVKYYAFEDGKVDYLGDETYTRVEVKEEATTDNSQFVKNLISEVDSTFVIAKKVSAFDRLHAKRQLNNTYMKDRTKNEFEQIEFESKLAVPSEEPFHTAKKMFKEGKFDFIIPSYYPFTRETASFQKFYKTNRGALRAVVREDRVIMTRKTPVEIVEDSLGVNAVTKRKEINGHFMSTWSSDFKEMKPLAEMYRNQKAMILENPSTKSIFYLCLDDCHVPEESMKQMEVEYLGTYERNNNLSEEEIVDDIARITKILMEKIPSLKPTALTKQEWAVSHPNAFF